MWILERSTTFSWDAAQVVAWIPKSRVPHTIYHKAEPKNTHTFPDYAGKEHHVIFKEAEI